MNTIKINFGKYKGQTLEDINNDINYKNYLISQSWFKEKYNYLYKILKNKNIEINNDKKNINNNNTKNNITINNIIFKSKAELKRYLQEKFYTIGITNDLKKTNYEFFCFVYELCQRHPDKDYKLNNFKNFIIKKNDVNKKGFELNIIDNDDNIHSISWITCINSKTTPKIQLFKTALRQSVYEQIIKFKISKNNQKNCLLCDCIITPEKNHIDHIIPFENLVNDFLKNITIKIPENYGHNQKANCCIFNSNDKWIGDLFYEYHLENARLRKICLKCNISRNKK